MNRLLLLITIVLCTTKTFSQDNEIPFKKNEIKFNIPMTIAGLAELNYERLIDDNIGLGLAAAIAIDKPENMPYRYQFTPFGRMYFGKKPGAGFFIEANMTGCQQRDIYTDWIWDTTGNYVTVDQSSFNFGFGAAAGVKLITRNNYVGEIYAGGGRLFGNSVLGGYFRIGLTIGKRF